MCSDEVSEPTSSVDQRRRRTASRINGSGAAPAAKRSATSSCTRASRRSGDASGSASSPTPERVHSSSALTARSTSSDAGRPSTPAAAPGANRSPTIVVPGASTSTDASVSGPTTRGTAPTRQTSSTAPLGTLRWTYGGASQATCWTHTDETSPTSSGTGG